MGELFHGEHGDYMVFEVHSGNKRIWKLRVDTWIAILGGIGLGAVLFLMLKYQPPPPEGQVKSD